MASPESDYVRSFLRDYAVQLRIGVYPSEKQKPQTVIVNIEMEAIKPPRYDNLTEETLDHVMDYAQVHHFITAELKQKGHIPLLETVAEMIIAFCFRDPRVAKVCVRLEKPGVLPGVAGAGIEMFRVRDKA